MLLEVPQNDQANRAVEFINQLTHTKGRWAKQPFNLRPWQEIIIRRLFGTLTEDGLRQYKTALWFMPRKNGKSELAAAIALYCLCSEPEASGEIYSAAADREQASLIFRVASSMVRNDPTLSRLCRIVDSQRVIEYQPTRSVYRAIPADAPHAHGFDASAVIVDELHTQRTRELWDVLTTSFGSRLQPLAVGISTAGVDRESLAYQLYTRARQVRDGITEDATVFPVIYEAPEDADWTNEQVWYDANPALGDFRSLADMRDLFREAQQVPARETVFRQLYLNQWVQSASRWLSSEAWKACGTEPVLPNDLRGLSCTAGLDLAYRDDFAALVLLFELDGIYKLLPFFWLPEEGKRDLSKPPHCNWVRGGHVIVSPGESTHFPSIRDKITELGKLYQIRAIAVDPWNARQLASELIDDGFEIVEFAQTMRNFNEPTKEFETLVKAKKLHHGNHPILSWMADNVCVEQDASGNYRPSKKKSTEKIDGIVAGIMALAMHTQQPAEEASIYETYGNLSL